MAKKTDEKAIKQPAPKKKNTLTPQESIRKDIAEMIKNR